MTSFLSLAASFYLLFGKPTPVLTLPPDSNQLTFCKLAPGVFASEWENAKAWLTVKNQETVQFSYNALLPELQTQPFKESQVIVFIRGYAFKDTVASAKPLSLPFYFFMADEKVVKPLYWGYSATSEQLNITVQAPLKIEEEISQVKEKIQFRYFLLDKAFLKKQKLSQKDLKNLSYQELVRLTANKP